MSDILEVVLHDEELIANEIVPVKMDDSITHYGRLGMKWYQHIYGEYQGAAKYAEKGARRVDKLQDRGKIAAAKKLRKKVDKFLSIAEKNQQMSDETKRKIAESINEHSSDKEVQGAARKIREFEATSKASDEIIDNLRQDRINDLTRGVADWKKASSEDIAAAITRLNLEKQYKEIRDEVSGAKVWKDAGKKALESVAGSSGKILEEVVKTAGNIAEKKNEAELAAQKDARTWAREDETHARDRKEKLQDQAREDKNSELKAQREIAKEEAKNRADYLKAQTDAKKREDDIQKDTAANDQTRANNDAIREVLEGRRAETSLTADQAKGLSDYVDRMFSGTKNVRQVLDSNERKRKREKAKADAEAEAKAQADFDAQNEKAYKEASEAKRVEREQGAAASDKEMARRQEEYDAAERARKRQAAADQAVREREAAEQYKSRVEKETAIESVSKQYEAKRQNEAAEQQKRSEAKVEEQKKQAADKESAYDFYRDLQNSKRSSDASGSSSNNTSTESINDKLRRNLAALSAKSVTDKAIVESVDTGSSLIDGWFGRNTSKATPKSYDSRNAKIRSFINNGGTWAEAEKKFDVSSSTISDILGHSNVSVFKRLSRDEYYATYKGLKWKSAR